MATQNDAAGRRDFLRKVLRTVAYTAPVTVAMSMRRASAAQPSFTPPKGKGKGKGGG